MTIVRVILALCLAIAASACTKTRPVQQKKAEPANNPSAASRPKKTLSTIDISKIGHIAPKGRVQDKDYNELEVVDDLIANGKNSIPFLISKLDDGTVIRDHVMDFWPEVTVGDVALLILSDFSRDSTWTKETIPGANWEGLLEARQNPDIPFWEYYDTQVRKHGRNWVKAKWEKIWTTYKDRIVWDDHERCFKLA